MRWGKYLVRKEKKKPTQQVLPELEKPPWSLRRARLAGVSMHMAQRREQLHASEKKEEGPT